MKELKLGRMGVGDFNENQSLTSSSSSVSLEVPIEVLEHLSEWVSSSLVSNEYFVSVLSHSAMFLPSCLAKIDPLLVVSVRCCG